MCLAIKSTFPHYGILPGNVCKEKAILINVSRSLQTWIYLLLRNVTLRIRRESSNNKTSVCQSTVLWLFAPRRFEASLDAAWIGCIVNKPWSIKLWRLGSVYSVARGKEWSLWSLESAYYFRSYITLNFLIKEYTVCSAQTRTGIGLLGKPPAVKQFHTVESH